MLVLSRKPGQAIVLNGVVRVVIGEISPDGRVKLLIDAPPDVIVLREELLDDASHDPVPTAPKGGQQP